jgi:hypothetical protein
VVLDGCGDPLSPGPSPSRKSTFTRTFANAIGDGADANQHSNPFITPRGRVRPKGTPSLFLDKETIMHSSPTPSECRERLQQAKRLLQGLSETERIHNFDITVFAVTSPNGVVGCIAGLCGLDPWFQERGLFTTVGVSIGSVSIPPEEFFGSETPFYRRSYLPKTHVSVDDAIAALDRAQEELVGYPASTANLQ